MWTECDNCDRDGDRDVFDKCASCRKLLCSRCREGGMICATKSRKEIFLCECCFSKGAYKPCKRKYRTLGYNYPVCDI